MSEKKIVVQFGAGQIGRGFIGALFFESGYEVVFVEAVHELVERLNAKGSYRLNIVGQGACSYEITNIKALHISDTDEVAMALAQAEVACTAVGVTAMTAIAPLIAAGIELRSKQGNQTPLNFLICENQLHADQLLREAVRSCMHPDTQPFLDEFVGFAQCVVSRMVPIATDEERQSLNVRAEAYKQLPVDKAALKGDPLQVIGLQPVDNFEAYIERKLFVHNASHAILAYLGALKGYEYGYEALADPVIHAQLNAAILPILDALEIKHRFSRQTLRDHWDDLLNRYQNRDLGDTVFRLARDPLRKLRPDDRLIGAALLIQEYGLDIAPISFAIAAALRFDDTRDPSAVKLKEMITTQDIDSVLQSLCGLEPYSPLFNSIKNCYLEMK